ncbi:hypothetical protein BgiBS90_004486 [Biomphalaria glabrata]|nr:hypothetical protein BgiBS90_004486 [Biomphalaria glabrata]
MSNKAKTESSNKAAETDDCLPLRPPCYVLLPPCPKKKTPTPPPEPEPEMPPCPCPPPLLPPCNKCQDGTGQPATAKKQ